MKNRILFLLWMTSLFNFTNAQSFSGLYIANSFSTQLSNKKAESQIFTGSLSIQKINKDSLKNFFYEEAYYLQKSRSQSINAIVLMAGGSMISAAGIRYGISRGYAFTDKMSSGGGENKYEKISCTRLALTGLVMMAGSIPYFISALKNKNKAGLKLTSQKTIFGASGRACKKVTSLTFSIPIGK